MYGQYYKLPQTTDKVSRLPQRVTGGVNQPYIYATPISTEAQQPAPGSYLSQDSPTRPKGYSYPSGQRSSGYGSGTQARSTPAGGMSYRLPDRSVRGPTVKPQGQQRSAAIGDGRQYYKDGQDPPSSRSCSAMSGMTGSSATIPPEVVRANAALASQKKTVMPSWVDAWGDDFGATGTCLGYPAPGAPQASYQDGAGWSLDYPIYKESQVLNNSYQQATSESSDWNGSIDVTMEVFDGPDVYESEMMDITDDQYEGWINHLDADQRMALDILLIESLSNSQNPLPVPALTADSPYTFIDRQCMPSRLEEDISMPEGDSHLVAEAQPPVQFVYSNGHEEIHEDENPSKPRHGRRGPLPPEAASKIAKTRKEKSVCISCRIRKVACEGGSPCISCTTMSRNRLTAQPCLRADFVEIICAGSCNYTSQRQLNHLTLDGTRRVKKTLPEELDFPKLLSLTKQLRGKYDIRASQGLHGTVLWTLDSSMLYDFLLGLKKRARLVGHTEWAALLDTGLPLSSKWRGCVKDFDEEEDLLSVLHRWNTMPSQVCFSLVSLDRNQPSGPLDIQDADQEDKLILAAQVSRIVGRALEMDAFNTLQKRLNKPSTYNMPSKLQKLCHQVGQMLLLFRWRIAWWFLSGDGNANDIQSKQDYISRLRQLALVLYFYFCAARAKLPSYGAADKVTGIQRYKDGRSTFFEYFPHENSLPGWETWIDLGTTLVAEVKRQKPVEQQGPYYPRPYCFPSINVGLSCPMS